MQLLDDGAKKGKVMKELLMMKGAKTLVDVATKVQAGETVLLVTDYAKTDIAQAVAAVACDRGAEVMIMSMKPRKRGGEEPPAAVAAAMKNADVVIVPVSYSITHTHAVKNAAAAGARIIVMTDFTPEVMMHGGIEADFDQIKPTCIAVAKALETAEEIHITSPGGTDLRFNTKGRRGNALYCVVEKGQFSTIPTIEANTTPIEGTAEGIIVCDASIPYLGIGLVDEPVICKVEGGFITEIKGGRAAEILRKDLASHADKNSYNIAELGIGLNPKCRMCGIMLEDEGVLGTCHIGIGTSLTLGGVTKAPCHYDLIMWHPTIAADGKVIFDKDHPTL